ncbi:hypothetical protein O3P69_007184 [Scylla paramamosain]|uniref:Uncharacterized protein n=1 Tax=Scylla paramamosain TaxID=85552 RepID=A0AAW0V4H0_SCYPA
MMALWQFSVTNFTWGGLKEPAERRCTANSGGPARIAADKEKVVTGFKTFVIRTPSRIGVLIAQQAGRHLVWKHWCSAYVQSVNGDIIIALLCGDGGDDGGDKSSALDWGDNRGVEIRRITLKELSVQDQARWAMPWFIDGGAELNITGPVPRGRDGDLHIDRHTEVECFPQCCLSPLATVAS